jgi:AraC-like DNA-binding protein
LRPSRRCFCAPHSIIASIAVAEILYFYPKYSLAIAKYKEGEDVAGQARTREVVQRRAFLEKVLVPPEQSYVWRKDDYPWRRSVWNYHPEFEIHLIRHSNGLCYVGDHIGTFQTGQLVLVGSNLPHNWVTPNIGDKIISGRDIVVQFDADKFRQAAKAIPEFMEVDGLFQHAQFGIEFLGTTAVLGAQLLERMGQVKGLAQFSRLLDLLSMLKESTEYRTLASSTFLSDYRPATISDLNVLERALSFIQENYLVSPSLAAVAKHVEMSESSFSRFFKSQTGNTFSDHVISLKMWSARKLLSESNMAITDICYESGFRNISNFNRTFLFLAGMKPSHYRRAAHSRGELTIDNKSKKFR